VLATTHEEEISYIQISIRLSYRSSALAGKRAGQRHYGDGPVALSPGLHVFPASLANNTGFDSS
jgi:hypothetical protein